MSQGGGAENALAGPTQAAQPQTAATPKPRACACAWQLGAPLLSSVSSAFLFVLDARSDFAPRLRFEYALHHALLASGKRRIVSVSFSAS